MGRAHRGRLDSCAGRVQGLRTLAIGTRVMDEQWLSEWDARYQEAAALLDGRDEATEELMEEVETDLELVGVSAIEDKLQDGVPAAIQTLLDAGIKVACDTTIWAPLWAFLRKAAYRCHVASQAGARSMQGLMMPPSACELAHIEAHCDLHRSGSMRVCILTADSIGHIELDASAEVEMVCCRCGSSRGTSRKQPSI